MDKLKEHQIIRIRDSPVTDDSQSQPTKPIHLRPKANSIIMEDFLIHISSLIKHKPLTHFLSISKVLKFNHQALNDLTSITDSIEPSATPDPPLPTLPSPPVLIPDIILLLNLFYSYLIHKPSPDLEFFKQLSPSLSCIPSILPNLESSKPSQTCKLENKISMLQSLVKLKLEQFQPMTLSPDILATFPNPFRIFYSLAKKGLQINNKKLVICLKEFKRQKKVWQVLKEADYKIFIKLLMCEEVCSEAKRAIDGILANAPGSVRQDSVESLNLFSRVQRIDLGKVFCEGIKGKCYWYRQDVNLLVNGRSFEAVLSKEFYLETVGKNDVEKNVVEDKAENIFKINYLAGGNIAKVFAYYNFLSRYRSIVRIQEKFDYIESFKFEDKFKNPGEIVSQYKNLIFSLVNLNENDLLPDNLTIRNFCLIQGIIKLKNLDACLDVSNTKGKIIGKSLNLKKSLQCIETIFTYLSFNFFRECLDVDENFKDFENFEDFWGQIDKQDKKNFCDKRKNSIALKFFMDI